LQQIVNESRNNGSTIWQAYVKNPEAVARTFRVYVICASATQISAPTGSVDTGK
jgi:hypothetical protein